MSESRDILTSLPHRLGVAGPARVCASQGSGAPSRRRALVILSVFATALGLLAFASAPALAAAPETPEATPASPIAATTATLHGLLNPGAPGNPGFYEFLYKQSASECQGEGEVATSVATVTGAMQEPAEAKVTELLPNTNYTFCLRAKNEAGEETLSAPVTFRTLPEAYATNLTASSATLHAVLNPEGSSLSYHFEYGTGTAYGSQTPEASTSLTDVEAHIQDLSAATLYHYRVIATDAAHETFESEDHTFTTQHVIGEFALPDGRQYEMVTPPEKEGALFYPLHNNDFVGRPIQASVNGDAIADLASQPTEADPNGYSEEVSVLSTRGPGGWSSQDIAGPHERVASMRGAEGDESRLFSEDLSHVATQQFGNFTPLSPEASESTPYLRTNYFNQNVNEHCEGSYLTAGSCFQPLVTKANTRAGAVFGQETTGECFLYICGPVFMDATPDLSHIVLYWDTLFGVQLTTSLPQGWAGEYEWSGGQLQPLPGALAREGTNAISADGGRVILTNGMFEVATGEVVPYGGTFQTASSDDSKIFSIDGGGDLIECEIVVEVAGKHKCNLSDLTPPLLAGGEPANVRAVLGVSEDGSYVYFAASGALAPGAVPDGCGPTVEGCNVYVRHDGVTRLVTASGLWEGQGASGNWRVSPNGRWLAFMSRKSLTGYDNRDAVSGQPDSEVYLYHAETSPAGALEPGKLVCASCDPTGARPTGVNEDAERQGWTAASVPYRMEIASFSFPEVGPLYQSRYLSDSGRLFFDSNDALVPQDVNGVEDVYEYEPEGVPAGEHACSSSSTSGSEVFEPARAFQAGGVTGEEGAGCVALISSGISSDPSSFLDASGTGGDVFFLTTAKLAPQDFDDAADVYDAHECTSASPCTTSVVAPPPCTTEASCKPPPTPQPSIYGLPASATFSGPGNLAPPPPAVVKKVTKKTVKCKKGFVKNKKNECVRKKSSKAKKLARKSSNNRRTSR